jgi:hypothetical protein
MKGKFKPQFPQKYAGDANNIVFRSKWELDVMRNLDRNTEVATWASEELAIPYVSPLDNRVHRYYVDMLVKMKSGEVVMIEVKPYKETKAPEAGKRKKTSKTYIHEVTTYMVNSAKWKAARELCEKNGWKFRLLTEHEIYGRKNGG